MRDPVKRPLARPRRKQAAMLHTLSVKREREATRYTPEKMDPRDVSRVRAGWIARRVCNKTDEEPGFFELGPG